MKMQRLMKKMRRATALILAGLMIAMTVDISGLKVRAEEKQNNDTVIATSDSEKLDVSKLNTEKTSFGVVYSDYIVINEDNVNDFNGKTLTGTTTNGIYISNGVTVDLTIENLNITKSEDISSCISVGYGATLNLTVKGENNLKATGWDRQKPPFVLLQPVQVHLPLLVAMAANSLPVMVVPESVEWQGLPVILPIYTSAISLLREARSMLSAAIRQPVLEAQLEKVVPISRSQEVQSMPQVVHMEPVSVEDSVVM